MFKFQHRKLDKIINEKKKIILEKIKQFSIGEKVRHLWRTPKEEDFIVIIKIDLEETDDFYKIMGYENNNSNRKVFLHVENLIKIENKE